MHDYGSFAQTFFVNNAGSEQFYTDDYNGNGKSLF